jgi:hypothetical protein
MPGLARIVSKAVRQWRDWMAGLDRNDSKAGNKILKCRSRMKRLQGRQDTNVSKEER